MRGWDRALQAESRSSPPASQARRAESGDVARAETFPGVPHMTTHDPVQRALSALKDADRARHAPSEIDRLVLDAFDCRVRERHTAWSPTAAWTTRLMGLAAALIVIIS